LLPRLRTTRSHCRAILGNGAGTNFKRPNKFLNGDEEMYIGRLNKDKKTAAA